MPSRRQFLSGLGTAVAIGTTGCVGSISGSSDSDQSGGTNTVDCQSHALAHGDGNVLERGAIPSAKEDGDVRIGVPISAKKVKEQNVNRLIIYDSTGEAKHIIPILGKNSEHSAHKHRAREGELYYEQYLGQRPFHGEYQIVVVNRDGEQVDSITFEFNCFPETDE